MVFFKTKNYKTLNNYLLVVVTVVGEPGPEVVVSGDGSGDVIKTHLSSVLTFTRHTFHSEVAKSHSYFFFIISY